MALFEIKSRWNGSVLFSLDCGSLELCVEAAVEARANLAGANLTGANLADANLTDANLARAYLADANLARANLAGAYLAGANLADANLTDANLAGANLADANLADANLARAYLADANLARANLAGAYLAGANLAGAEGINPNRIDSLRMMLDQVGKIRAYKLVCADGKSPIHSKKLTYRKGETIEELNANTDESVHCGEGINVADLPWCMRNWYDGCRILIVEFTRKDIAAIPIGTDGKFRLFRCKVVGEKDLVEIGLMGDKDNAEK